MSAPDAGRRSAVGPQLAEAAGGRRDTARASSRPTGTPPRQGAGPQLAEAARASGKHVPIALALLLELFPLYMMAQISLKTNADFIRRPFAPQWPGPAALGNWRHAADLVLPYVTNTVFVAVLGTAGSLCLSLLGAYFFARRPMPGRRVLWAAFLALMLMPGVVNLVPLFALVKRLDLLNSLWALVLLAIAGGQVFQLYILRGFIEDLPRDLFDAAEIDGASHARQVCHIVVPLSGSILGTLAILQFLGLWNDFMMPLIILRDPELFTMGVGLIYLQNEYVRDWGRLMASYCVASLPLVVLFLLAMRLFVRGLTAVALKG